MKIILVLILASCVVAAEAWSGGLCVRWRWFRCTVWYTDYRCASGWRHNGDRNCNIPICYPNCGVGTCVSPNQCQCPDTHTGQFCQQLVCSYETPCYPGNCYNYNQCNCTQGFLNQPSTSGCLKMDNNELPYIGRSTTSISYMRETDQKRLYYFLLDGTEEDAKKTVEWINQQTFNQLAVEFEARYDQPEEIADKPDYVSDTEFGIVYGDVRIQVFDFMNRTMERSKYQHECPGLSFKDPVTEVMNCTIDTIDFKTLVEDGDTVLVRFRIRSGGFRRLINTQTGRQYSRMPFDGVEAEKRIEFKFDFRTPKFCQENESDFSCPSDPTVLSVANEFTKESISLRWAGWADTLYGSGLWYYYLELHELVSKDARNTLEELNPINPPYSATIMDERRNGDYTHSIKPPKPGMYSILMEVRDVANNSRLARRFVLYDPESEIELDIDSRNGLHIPSAAKETGYRWQSVTGKTRLDKTRIVVSWEGLFINRLHEQGKFLNEIQPFPVQFNDIVDDQLMVRKFVSDYLDDNEGSRTKAEVPNIRSIVRFEYAVVYTMETTEPTSGWTDVPGPNDRTTLQESLSLGQTIRVWVRGFDAMGNNKSTSTLLTLDYTNPVVNDASLVMTMNDNSTESSYDSSIEFDAEDTESGIHEIEMNIVMFTPGKGDKTFNVKTPANFSQRTVSENDCYRTADAGRCFRRHQLVQLDHCWFMLPVKDDLVVSHATVDITVYNQAMLTDTIQVKIPRLSALSGLEIFAGPGNVRIVNTKHDSFRITWDLPDQMSCYGRADINIIITYTVGETPEKREHRVSADSVFFDVGGVPPDTHFIVLFSSTLGGGGTTLPETFSAKTATAPENEGSNLVLILGVAGGVLLVVCLIVVIFVIAVRRGIIQPREKVRRMHRVIKERVRSMAPTIARKPRNDNCLSEEVYICMDHLYLDRKDVSLEAEIKSGSFANIYKATLRTGQRQGEVVVAKTLKENYTPEDELLMKAKINFFGSVVEDHPNILKFIGAVMTDNTFGPFMIYEHCDNGNMRDYLVSHKNDVSLEMQEKLFRFGLDIAKGMENLASRPVQYPL